MAVSEKYARMTETGQDIRVKDTKRESFWRKAALAGFLLVFVVGVILFCVFTYTSWFHCAQHGDDSKLVKKNETEDDGNKLHFLWFSDLHLDLYYKSSASPDWSKSYCRNASVPATYNAPFGRIGCDSPRTLLRNALYAMNSVAKNRIKPKFIIMTGDASAHNLDGEFPDHTTRRERVLKAMETATDEVKLAFPMLPFFPSLGNNDLPGHYVLPERGDSWYQDLLNFWEESILCESCELRQRTTTRRALRKTFLKGGYYKVNLPGTRMILLVLNSMLWAKKCWVPGSQFLIESANEQMKWLETQLKLAKMTKRRVVIQSHMPPGTDSFEPPYSQVWLKNYTEEYLELVTNGYGDVVASQLYAHYHTDEYRLLRSPSDHKARHLSHILLTSAISPVYNNNPNFRIVQVNKKRQAIEDFMQYYLELVVATQFDTPYWQFDYKFSKRYPSQGKDDEMINGKRILRLNENIIDIHKNDVWLDYFGSHTVHHQPSNEVSRFVLYCAMKTILEDEFAKCHAEYNVDGA